MKNLARFFLKKVNNVSDFVFHLKKAITFHVLAEFFLKSFERQNKSFWVTFEVIEEVKLILKVIKN